MKLEDIVSQNKVLTQEQVKADTELLKQIQTRYADIYLYPKDLIDGLWGPKCEAATANFCKQENLSNATTGLYGASFAKALLAAKVTILVTKTQAETIFGRTISTELLDDLNACLVRFEINTSARMQMFFSQICHESGNLKWMKELASGDAYEGRRDLGNTQQGDGKRFKGAGCIQLTGRANYQALANYLKDFRVMEGCNYVAQKYPFTSAGLWWHKNGLNQMIDRGATIEQVSARVNGRHPANGLAERIHYYKLACKVIQ